MCVDPHFRWWGGVTERRTYHHVPLCIVCDCYSMAYLSVPYQACGFFLVSCCWDVFSSVFRDSNTGSSLISFYIYSELKELNKNQFNKISRILISENNDISKNQEMREI